MTTSKDEIVDKIGDVRRGNNDPWMTLVKLAFKGFPDEAAAAMKEIADNDTKITQLCRMLVTCA